MNLVKVADAIFDEDISFLNSISFEVNKPLGYPVGCVRLFHCFIHEVCKIIPLFYS
jgi:hypothetical protein